MGNGKSVFWLFGYEYCRLGRPCETSVALTPHEASEFESGYAFRYEEEQQLTHKTEAN